MMEYLFGIDIGGSSIKTGIFSAKGILNEKSGSVTDRSEKGRNILTDIRKETIRMAGKLDLDIGKAGTGNRTLCLGRKGCLNQYASTEGLMRIADRKAAAENKAGS